MHESVAEFVERAFLRASAAMALDALGLSTFARHIEQSGLVSSANQLGLEGMLALWRPAIAN